MKCSLKFLLLILLFIAVAITGCSDDNENQTMIPGTGNPTGDPITGNSQTTITIAASHAIILQNATATLTATVIDSSGNPIAETNVLFSMNNENFGSLSSPSATTNENGIASVIFTGTELTGTATFSATSEGVTSNVTTIRIDNNTNTEQPALISLNEPNPTAVLIGGTSSISATLYDAGGTPLGEGVSVEFTVADSTIGSISPSTVTTDRSGVATSTFTAGEVQGTTEISAISMGTIASTPVEISVLGATPAVISFYDVSSNIISVKQSGGIEYTRIRFIVKDDVDRPVPGEPVSFRLLKGPGGGEYIDATDETPDTIDASTDENGYATVVLHSGFAAGPVTIQATIIIENTPISVNTSVVSIGGGVLSDERFDVAASLLNVPGLYILGYETEITAYLADRFGNYNILDGTTVSFSTETGLTSFSSGVTQAANGMASVKLRTQNEPKNVAPLTWETDLINDIESRYGTTFTGHPRDGLCSVLVSAKGEEHFTDLNGNGFYETEEDLFDASYDTEGDPFCDYDDDNAYDDENSENPAELFIDSINDGLWTDSNGVWDADKTIFRNFPILITGQPLIYFEEGFHLGNNETRELKILICDRNLNSLSPGSTVTISLNSIDNNAEIISGTTDYEYININSVGNSVESHLNYIEFSVMVTDIDPETTADPPNLQKILVEVNWEDMKFSKHGSFYVE